MRFRGIGVGIVAATFTWSLACGTPAPAGADTHPLGTPALLSIAQMTSGTTPQLRIVDQAIASPSLEGARAAWNATLPLARAGVTTSRLGRGMEVLARYSLYRADDSPTPWEEGLPSPLADRREDKVLSVGHTRERDLGVAEASDGALAFSSALARDPRAGVAWSGPVRSEERSVLADMDGSSSSLVRSVARVATPILEVADALRAVRLNQVRLSDDLTLKLNGRTGRHARCFAILTHRF